MAASDQLQVNSSTTISRTRSSWIYLFIIELILTRIQHISVTCQIIWYWPSCTWHMTSIEATSGPIVVCRRHVTVLQKRHPKMFEKLARHHTRVGPLGSCWGVIDMVCGHGHGHVFSCEVELCRSLKTQEKGSKYWNFLIKTFQLWLKLRILLSFPLCCKETTFYF